MGDRDQKTEAPTPKKRNDERKKGHVFISREAIAVVTLFGSMFLLRMTFLSIAQYMSEFMLYCLSFAGMGPAEAPSNTVLHEGLRVALRSTGPLLIVTILLVSAATLAQTRGLVTAELIKPKFDKLNPINGFKNLFSLRSVVELVKNLLKIILLLILIYSSLRDLTRVSERYMYSDLRAAAGSLLLAIYAMILRVSLAFTALAFLDYLYQHWDFEQNLKMTKEEVKEEYKMTEGNPQIKGRIRDLQRQMARARMMQQVPQADVIIRNPTHVAVALRYRYREDPAPVVLAMGVDHIALRIIAIAEHHDILVIENPPLARALYAEAELNKSIPSDLYEAVAEVMVYLYRLGRMRTDMPDAEAVPAEPEE